MNKANKSQRMIGAKSAFVTCLIELENAKVMSDIPKAIYKFEDSGEAQEGHWRILVSIIAGAKVRLNKELT